MTSITNSTSNQVSLYALEQTSKAATDPTSGQKPAPTSTSDTVTISAEAKALSENSTIIQPLSAGGTQLPPLPPK